MIQSFNPHAYRSLYLFLNISSPAQNVTANSSSSDTRPIVCGNSNSAFYCNYSARNIGNNIYVGYLTVEKFL